MSSTFRFPEELVLSVGHDDADATSVSNITEVCGSSDAPTWQSNKLCGRDSELQICLGALARTVGNIREEGGGADHHHPERILGASELLIIHGSSGCGKSALAESLRRPTLEYNGYYTEGKFDQYTGNNVPYSAVMLALADLMDLILNHHRSEDDIDQRQIMRIQQDIRSSLTEDSILQLSALIPNLDQVAGLRPTEHQADTPTMGQQGQDQAFDKLKVMLRNLIKAIASKETPICIFLDDLQWADVASMELIKTFVSDLTSKYILIVTAYRDDSTMTETADRLLPKTSIRVTDIALDNLTETAAAEMLAGLLKIEDSDSTMSLTKILYSKTKGNCFFMHQILRFLHSEGTLMKENDHWQWDHLQLRDVLDISDNVLEIVAKRIDSLTFSVQFLLQHAACLGHRFQRSVLEVIMDGILNNCIDGFEDASREARRAFVSASQFFGFRAQDLTIDKFVFLCLAHAYKLGIVNECSFGWYKFNHDRVQEYFYDCLGETRAAINLLIGTILHRSDRFAIENMSFFLLTIDQLNAGSQCLESDTERMNLMQQNLRAAELVQSRSAYWSAKIYLYQALGLVSLPQAWEVDYELTLRCCTLAARMNYICGDLTASDDSVQQVLRNARTFMDKLPTTNIAISSLASRGYNKEAKQSCLTTLKEMKRKFPSRPTVFHVLTELSRVDKLVARLSDEELLNLPPVSDLLLITEMQLLSILSFLGIVNNDANLAALSSLRLMHLTCQHGFPEQKAFACSMFGLIQSSIGNVAKAIRFGTLATELMHQQKDQYIDFSHRAAVVTWSFCMHYCRKYSEIHTGIFQTYVAGNDLGLSYEVASTASSVCFLDVVYGYKSLKSSMDEYGNFLNQLIDADYSGVFVGITRVCCQALRNQQADHITRPWILSGEFAQEDAITSDAKRFNWPILLSITQNLKLQLAVVFNQWHEALKQALHLGGNGRSLRSHASHFVHLLFSGLTYTVNYNQTPSWKLKRLMQRKIGQVRKFANLGAPLCQPILAFLEAEKSVKNGNKAQTEELFLASIHLLGTDGHECLKAFAYERLAYNLRHSFNSRSLSRHYWQEAISCYSEWGAARKVKQLRDEAALQAELDEMSFHHLAALGTVPNDEEIGVEEYVH